MNYLSIDLEMSGTEPGWHEIIQIGAVLYNENWVELDRYISNVYPENEESYSQSSFEVHGLSLADLDDAPMLNEVLPDFEAWILKTLNVPVNKGNQNIATNALRSVAICGQSVIYDINFMRFAYRQEKLQWPFSNQTIDLNNLAFYLFAILKENGVAIPKGLSLTAIADFFHLEREGESHNALEDAVITGECLKRVMEYTKQLSLKK
ncbi:3'-5' exonuclease [Williamwhitmania taraxaci]|uniref:DNA polymerase-3 subunit epsilon n=1 Tax=Williamwhitmania taraxaci TaxID=1640674 RepID=A0A1G6I1D2_9BACT|nr:3'-5' exonuclease [Williamwhitmania taraxaci]SDC00193.1 DNA polymerase-3 subunit epsilon [Williamwhitmania taraxaci]